MAYLYHGDGDHRDGQIIGDGDHHVKASHTESQLLWYSDYDYHDPLFSKMISDDEKEAF